MTWLKLSDDFAEDCVRAGLSDSAYRTHVDGLIWSMRRGTDGYLDHVSVRKGLDSEHVTDAIEELCAAGFWRHEGGGYQIVHHMEHQPEAAVVDARRAATAERVRRHRLKKAGLDSGNASCNALQDSGEQRVAVVGKGRGGSGKGGKKALEVSTTRGDTTTHPGGSSSPACGWCHGSGFPDGCEQCGQVGYDKGRDGT